MKTYFFCTYFDKNYSAKGLALYYSIQKHVQSFRLYILCLDNETHAVLSHLKLPSVILIPLEELEQHDPELFATKKKRTLIEYYFTLTPAFILHIIKEFPDIDIISYVDADMFLFAPITPAYDEMGDNSILIIEHRFSKEERFREIHGRFNVGYLSFRRDEEGQKCLELWRKQCIEWCYDRIEGEKFADQKYLDRWPSIYSKIIVLRHLGVNVAPWNANNYIFHKEGESQYYVDEYPLILYHFHALHEILHIFNYFIYDMNLSTYNFLRKAQREQGLQIKKEIYDKYLSIYMICCRIIDDNLLHCDIKQGSIRGEVNNNNSGVTIQFSKKPSVKYSTILKKFFWNDLIIIKRSRKKI